jgi:uncharacterized repeat protein (TIGR01451 family)
MFSRAVPGALDRTPSVANRTLERLFALFMTALLLSSAALAFRAPAVLATEQPTSCGVRPIDLVIVIDRSGSMAVQEGANTRLQWAKNAANGLVSDFDAPGHGGVGGTGAHRVGISSFAGDSASTQVQLSAGASAATIATAVNGLAANGGTPFRLGMSQGDTNMTAGARTTFNGAEVKQVMIFLSDGNPDPDSYAPSATDISNYLGAPVDIAYAIAIGPDGGDLGGGGTGVSYSLMRSIAKPGYINDASPGAFRFVTSGSGLPALFDEIFEELSCPKGSLQVVKNVEPNSDLGKFDLSIDGTLQANEAGDGGSTPAIVLNAGNYAFGESADGETSLANYTSSASCINTAPQPDVSVTATQGQGTSWTVDVTADSAIVCTITNTRKTGTLTVTKQLTLDDGGTAACAAFKFAVNQGTPMSFETECTNVLTVPTGTYSVVEPNPGAGYSPSYAGCAEMVVTAGGNATCTITNNDQPGTLIVIKDLTKDDGGSASCDDFSFTVNQGQAIDFDHDCTNTLTVDAGTYDVVEESADGYATTYEGCEDVVVPNGGEATCTISNDDEPGTLIVTKIVKGGDSACDDFSFRVNQGQSMAFDDDCTNELTIDAGTYTVVEDASDGYTTTYDNCTRVTVPNGDKATCTITNTRQTGTVEIVKNLEPNADPGRFDLLLDGSSELDDAGDGGSTDAVTVDTGTHTVGEAAGSGTSLGNYASTITCTEDGGEGETVASAAGAGPLDVEVGVGDEIVCVITNTRVMVGIVKTNDAGHRGHVEPGEVVEFELTVTVSAGTATNVVVTDVLPDGLTYVPDSADPSDVSVDGQNLKWEIDSLSAGDHAFTYEATVDLDATGELTNLGCVDADQNHDFFIFDLFDDEEIPCSTTTLLVQDSEVVKTNGTTGPVTPGTAVDFTLTIGVTHGPIDDLTIVDELPDGLTVVDEASISDGGAYDAVDNEISWSLANVADGEELTYQAVVDADATAGTYRNVATITEGPCVGDCDDDSTVDVVEPALTVEKSASTDVITISGPSDAPVATPSIVTWTITYAVANGPLTHVVITDEIPAGFVFLDAANGGVEADGTVTWDLGTITTGGSVSFRTTVDPTTISRTGPTENVAVIDSDQTEPDEGEDAVTVTVVPPPQGGNPTPSPSLPDTAFGIGTAGETVSVPLELLVIAFIGSLGALTLANVRASNRRR